MTFSTHPSITEILQVPGYLFWNPTALTSEATWGAKIGFLEGGVRFEPRYRVQTYTEEEYGDEVRAKVFTGAAPLVTAVFKNWNATLASLFPGAGSSLTLKYPGAIAAGTEIDSTTYAKPLLFVPQDTTNRPCLLVQKAAPNPVETARLQISHTRQTQFPVVFDCLRKSSDADGIYYFGKLSGAVLR